ncbi:Hypothetical predicted protein [Lecanosticta acicola]|uniref:DUF7707 domain-containing protein n=1 Tax=Lecanosticta acicola TaxID=111012 RepID=A0AAI9EAV1_9PEZI|nr:Hypothetical predicted protein [Lecanosticta acicola]
MFRSALLVAISALAAVTSAQNYSTSGALSVDDSQLSESLRQAWCRAQTNSCPQICGGQASPNTCDPTTLNYTCTCTNGNTPNISSYDQTIPSFVCAQWKTNCVANHPNDLDGQTGCLSVVCGDRNASSGIASTTSSASASATASSTSSGTSGATGSATKSASASGTSATSTGAAVALSVAQNYGTGIVATALLALFGLAL